MEQLVRCSKLSAKVDNTAIQDGFQLYLHSFIVSDTGEWTVVQQGMHRGKSPPPGVITGIQPMVSFVDEPHTGICGINQGKILNMVAREAIPAQQGIIHITKEDPERISAKCST